MVSGQLSEDQQAQGFPENVWVIGLSNEQLELEVKVQDL